MTAYTPAVAAQSPPRPGGEHPSVVEREILATLEPLGRRGRIWIAALLAVTAVGIGAWIFQLARGLAVTDMRNVVSWGAYMASFVFFIGISHAGTLISAILRVTSAGWRRPITRMAEAITVIALLVGAGMVVIDMGRPDRVLALVLHGRLQSPVLWDLLSIATYIVGSVLYLYVAMIPDMPILARAARTSGRSQRLVRMYEVLSLGFRETPEHRRRLERALGAMAVIIIPVAVSVHTVVSWVFGMTLRPGWHSTIFGPYFVVGAIFSGTAAIITAMALFRRAYRLERWLRAEHFHRLGTILLALSLLYGYFTLSEYLTTWYGGASSETRLLDLVAGSTGFGLAFWLWTILGLLLPVALLLFPARRSITSIVTASVLINVGMWLKRYLIVVPTLQAPHLDPTAAGMELRYFPSPVELAITAGAFAAFLLAFTLFSRLFPILSIWETAEDAADEHARAPASDATRRRAAYATTAVLVAIIAASGGLRRADAQAVAGESASAQSAKLADPRITLRRSAAEGQDMLSATVNDGGRPVAGALVEFSVARAFGRMVLGSERTLGAGTASIPLPAGLRGDTSGRLTVRATVRDPAALEGATVTTAIAGLAPRVTSAAQPRALWSSRAPIALIVAIGGLLVCVWGTYAWVIAQLVALARIGGEGPETSMAAASGDAAAMLVSGPG